METPLEKTIEQLGSAFEEFKKANDERLKQIEEKGHADPLLEAKVDKANEEVGKLSAVKEQLEQLEVKVNRQGITSTGSILSPEKKEHADAFELFLRKGKDDGLKELERKALNITTAGDGGYAVPEELDQAIYDLIVEMSPMRRLATVKQIGSSDYKQLVNTRGTTSGWVAEAASRAETDTPTFAEFVPSLGEIYANPATTQQMIEDAVFDVGSFLAEEVATEIAYEEGAAFITGNGTSKPKGITAYTTAATADSGRAYGTLEHVASGTSATIAGFDPIIDLIAAMKSTLRNGASFLANSATYATLRKIKDGDSRYLWMPSLVPGVPSTLMGFAAEESEDMPALGANALAIAFGNFKKGYVIVDRTGTRVLRDPYTNKPYVHFYTTKRVGGGVRDSEAIKFIKCDA